MKSTILFFSVFLLLGCDKPTNQSSEDSTETTVAPVAMPNIATTSDVVRAYSAQQVTLGKTVFEKNCQTCHGNKGKGETLEWETAKADGSYPAPPLNGSAHTWHHSQKALLGTINRGGIPLGGRMPPFKDVLTEEEKLNVLAYVQNLWPDKIYQIWKNNN